MSSLSAKTPWPYQANYAASKACVSSLGQALRAEWGSNGVDVTVLEPGRKAVVTIGAVNATTGVALHLLPQHADALRDPQHARAKHES